MKRFLVEIYLPVSDFCYDVSIPSNSKIHEVIDLLGKPLSDLSGGMYIATADSVICTRENGEALDINLSVEEAGIKNGSKLMLI